jgi:predicted  nucleic acid-binding Zn-ribbon protein
MKHLVDLIFSLQNLESLSAPANGDDKEIRRLRENIPPPVLAHYDRLIARGKKGVALVRGKVCASCHMGVPLGSLNTLVNGDDLQLCGSCGRYLYMSAEEKTLFLQPPPAPKTPKRKPKPA